MQPSVLTRRTLLIGLGASATMSGAREALGAAPPRASQWGDLELADARDQAFRLKDGGLNATLVQLWASWCPICLDELTALSAAAPALHRRDIEVLLISSPLGWEADLRVAASRRTGVRCARPSNRNTPRAIRSALFDPDGWYYVPRSLLYDNRSGQVVWSHLGRLDWQSAPWVHGLPGTVA